MCNTTQMELSALAAVLPLVYPHHALVHQEEEEVRHDINEGS